jgi:hypothetical protein
MAGNRIEITDEIRAKLEAEKERTGLGGAALLRGKRGQYPDGLRSDMIDDWRTRKRKSAKLNFLEWVLQQYKNPKPDAQVAELNSDILKLLDAERKRTGTTPAALLKNCTSEVPEGLHSHNVVNWMQGLVKRVNREHLDFVLAEYAKLTNEGYRIKLTKDRRDLLAAEANRTGCGSVQILRLAAKPLPKGLNSGLINLWLHGKVQTVRRDHWEHVMKAYASLPDCRN